MCWGTISLSLAALSIGALLPAQVIVPEADAGASSTPLEPLKTIEREFAGGGAHDYRFALKEGEYARILLFQLSINVAVECFGPDGKLRFDADTEFIDEYETIELIGDAAGIYRLRVTAPDKHAPTGRYNITFQGAETATDLHKIRIAAARAFSQGRKSILEPGRENMPKAIRDFETAAGHWHDARDLIEEARSLMIAGVFWAMYGDRQKAFDREDRAMSVAQASGDRKIEGWSYADYAVVLNAMGDKKKAIDYANRGLTLLRETGDRAGEATALDNIGRAYVQTGESRKAIGCFEEALRIYGDLQDRGMAAQMTGNLGSAYDNLGEYQRALEYHEKKLALLHELEIPADLTLNNIAAGYTNLGEYQKALDGYSASLEIARKNGNQSQRAITLHNIAFIYGSLGDHQHALKVYQESLELVRSAGNQWAMGNTLNNIGATYYELGDYGGALKFHQEALAYRRAVHTQSGEAISLNSLGKTYARLGDREKAREYFESALAIFRKSGERLQLASTLRGLGEFYLNGGDYERSQSYLDEGIEISRTIQDLRGEASALALMAKLARAVGTRRPPTRVQRWRCRPSNPYAAAWPVRRCALLSLPRHARASRSTSNR
jgi:tetratricopeptide (TPR) repeat protein